MLADKITDQRDAEELLNKITEAINAVTGKEFFRSLTRNMAAALNVRYAFVTECLDQTPTRLRMLAFWGAGHFMDTLEYDLPTTPCEEVINNACVLHIPNHAGDRYPCQKEMGAESYLGLPIFDSKGQRVIGHVALMDDKPLPDDRLARAIFELFAGRAAAELQRQRAEEQARARLVELAHVSRLSCMGEMAAALAHELNQPLCAIMTYTQACLRMLPDDGNTAAEVRHAMERVSANAERAGEIIRHLRSFVGKGEPQQQCADINAVVNEVLGFFEADARATRVQLRTALGKVPEVTIDPVQIQQVILNLARNAIEAMDIPACTTRELAIETLRSDDRHIEVRVTDTGPGLPAEIAAKAFNAFITTKASGMGMGLSISRAIIEAHGGRIWVNERAGGGAVFHFTLPITND